MEEPVLKVEAEKAEQVFALNHSSVEFLTWRQKVVICNAAGKGWILGDIGKSGLDSLTIELLLLKF